MWLVPFVSLYVVTLSSAFVTSSHLCIERKCPNNNVLHNKKEVKSAPLSNKGTLSSDLTPFNSILLTLVLFHDELKMMSYIRSVLINCTKNKIRNDNNKMQF